MGRDVGILGRVKAGSPPLTHHITNVPVYWVRALFAEQLGETVLEGGSRVLSWGYFATWGRRG